MVSRIDHLGLYVADIEAAVRFWRDVVGLDCAGIEDHPETGLRLAHVCINGVELELIEAPVERTQLRHLPYQGPGLYHLALRTDDLAAEVARLQAAGVEMQVGFPLEDAGMRVQFTVPDPAGLAQGVMIELVQRLREAPADAALLARGPGDESGGVQPLRDGPADTAPLARRPGA